MYALIVTPQGLLPTEVFGPFDTRPQALAEADVLYKEQPDRRYQVLEVQQPTSRSI